MCDHRLIQLKNLITLDIQDTCNQPFYTVSTMQLRAVFEQNGGVALLVCP